MLRVNLLCVSFLVSAIGCMGQDCSTYNYSTTDSQNVADATGHSSYNHQGSGVFSESCSYTDQTNSNICAVQCTTTVTGDALDLGTVMAPYWHGTGFDITQGNASSNGPQVTCGGQVAVAVRSCIFPLTCDVTVSVSGSVNGIGGSASYSNTPLWKPTLTSSLTCAAKSTPGSGGGGNCNNPNALPGEKGFSPACTCVEPSCVSPIVIDTDGAGFHFTDAKEGVMFDFFGDDKPFRIAWPMEGSSNGWLALDRNGNGKIDNARELFGNVTEQPASPSPNGFLALAVFDLRENGGNNDGVIDKNDAVWSKLLVWIDANHDGVSQPEDLHSLNEVGVHQISLRYAGSPYTDRYGNQFRYEGSLPPVGDDRVDRVIYDVFLTKQ